MCNNNKTNEQGSSRNNLTTQLANWIIFISIIVLLITIAIGIISTCNNLSENRLPATITIEFKEDSLNTSVSEMQALKDSLNDIMLRREHILANKYQHIIEKRALEDSLFSMGSIIIGIIIAILGFFGFKSFQSIEENTKATEEAAKKAAKEAAKDVTNKIGIIARRYLDKNLTTEVNNAILTTQEDILQKILKDELNNNNIKFQERIDELNDHIDTINTIKGNIEQLEIQIKELTESINNNQDAREVKEFTSPIDAQTSKEPKNRFLKKAK
jgi:hypothetical protein